MQSFHKSATTLIATVLILFASTEAVALPHPQVPRDIIGPGGSQVSTASKFGGNGQVASHGFILPRQQLAVRWIQFSQLRRY